MARVSGFAAKLPEPQNYFVGKDWRDLLLPREVLCFLRAQQAEEGEWGAISTFSKRYDQHRRFVLLVVLEGSGRVGVETELWDFEAGDAVLMFPHQAHYYSKLAESFRWLFVTFELPPQFWEQLSDLRGSPRRVSRENTAQLASFLEEWQQCTDGRGAMAASCQLGEILKGLKSQEVVSAVGAESDLVRAVRERVCENLKGDLSVKALAEHLSVSGSYLREQFREGAGVSLGHFVRSVRLMQATKLLREGNESVREVAAECGFGSFTAFSRAFGQVYGTSPSVYRRLGASHPQQRASQAVSLSGEALTAS